MRITSVLALATILITSSAFAECTCKKAKVESGWCGDCKMGYVAGVTIKSHKLYDTVSASPNAGEKIECAECKKFAEAGKGFCTKCNTGFVGKNHYHSMAGYTLARGEAIDPATIKCEGCKKAAGSCGWCDTCKAGIVGYVVYKEKGLYEAAAKSRETLTAAAGNKCEGCAVAMASDGKCDTCKIEYKDGKKVEAKAEEKKPAVKP